MHSALQFAFRITALLLGSVLLYTVTAMFPDEEGRLQNRIENLWVAIDDKHKSAVDRTTLVFNRVASYVTRVYNRILGSRLFSIQMVGVSASSSIAGFFLFAVLLLWGLLYLSLSRHADVRPQFNVALLIVGLVCLVFSFVAIVFAVLPSIFRNWFGRTLSLIPLAIMLEGLLTVIERQHGIANGPQWSVLAALIIGVLTDILVLAGVRLSVRLIANTEKFVNFIWAVLVQVGALIVIIIIPYEASTPLLSVNKNSITAAVLLASMMFNLFTAIGIAAFLIVLFLLVVHRAFWPLLSRAMFSIARFKPLQNNRKTFTAIGIVCIFYGLGVVRWADMIEWFAKQFNPLK